MRVLDPREYYNVQKSKIRFEIDVHITKRKEKPATTKNNASSYIVREII